MDFKVFIKKLRTRLMKLRLRPVRVLCFHQVSDVFEPMYGRIENWTNTEQFKKNLIKLKETHTFVSLDDAVKHLRHDVFRIKRYAVLTCDDGYQCVLNLLPWLEEQQIPITLFLSLRYLDGKSYDSWFESCWKELSEDEKARLLESMYFHWNHLKTEEIHSENVTLAIHGLGHDDVSRLDEREFDAYVDECVSMLSGHPRYRPFYAYTWGRHSSENDHVLMKKNIVPVYCDGMNNFGYDGAIHRMWIDGDRFEIANLF